MSNWSAALKQCATWYKINVFLFLQESEGLVFHYWALFDGHAGSGAAVVASRLLQHHIACQLQAVIEILRNMSSPPPTVLGEEPDNNPYLQGNIPVPHRALTRAASLRGAAGAPGSPCNTPPPPRFFTEKKILHESLVIGAIENAFKEMVRGRCKVATDFSPVILTMLHTHWIHSVMHHYLTLPSQREMTVTFQKSVYNVLAGISRPILSSPHHRQLRRLHCSSSILRSTLWNYPPQFFF